MPILNRSNTERNKLGAPAAIYPAYRISRDVSAVLDDLASRQPTPPAPPTTRPVLRPKKKTREPAPRLLAKIPSMPGSACRQDRRGFRTADEPSQEKNACKPDYCFGGYAPAGLLNAVVHDIPVYLSPPGSGAFAVLFPAPFLERVIKPSLSVPQREKWRKQGGFRMAAMQSCRAF
jgi:hypothetical protein